MTNQDTLREIQRGYRLEKPNYPGQTTPQKLDGIYGVNLLKLNHCNKVKYHNRLIYK